MTEALKILVVEDNATQARLLDHALRTQKPRPILENVQDLKTTLERLRTEAYDLVLLDLGLPDSFGIETLRDAHQAAPDIPIVVLTALSDEEVAIEAVREGAQDYVDKAQITPKFLARVIRYAVERARSQREVRQANERFRLAASAAHEIIYEWDLRENTVFRSEGILRVLGIPAPEVGLAPQWWLERIHPDDAPQVKSILENALKSEGSFLAEYRVRHHNGRYVHLWDRGVIVRSPEGWPQRVVGAQLDVTERMRAEEEIRRTNEMLRTLIDASPLAIITVDMQAKVMSWNRAAEDTFGWCADEVVGNPLPIVRAEDWDELMEFLHNDVTGEPQRGIEVKRVRKDGSVLDVSLSTAPIRDSAGRVISVMGILEDITQRKRSEEERVKLQEQLHQTQKLEAVGQLAAGVAHDFNNLLTVILGNVDRLNKMLQEGDERRNVVTLIEEAARQATGVTRSLLTFSHNIPSVKRPTNLITAIEEAARLLQRLLPASVQLRLEMPDEPIWVTGDRSQLQQVIINLAINARDAMPHGGRIRITLGSAPNAAGRGRSGRAPRAFAMLRVEDTGLGIPHEIQDRIFEPFFTTKPRGQGTGLGLAIVRSIVADHEGTIAVESEPGSGATFAIALPETVSEPEQPPRERIEEQAPRGSGQTILLADDNAYVREVVASALRSFGYTVIEVGDGQAALEAQAQRSSEIAAYVFDHELPYRSGLDVIRAFRRLGDERPAIITSGSVGEDFEHQLEAGTILLRKPFQMMELARLLAGALAIRESGT